MMKKLNVTLEDTLADKHWRMFMAASTDLALVAHRLKVDPTSGGSAPIIVNKALKQNRKAMK